MAKKPKSKPQDEDEAQSARFIAAEKALEAAGELNLAEAAAKVEP